MKIVVAMDSFKGTLKADKACSIISEVIRKLLSDVVLSNKPMADGGEGTAKAMISTVGGQWIIREVMGPLEDMRVKAGFAWLSDETALVEMASTSGIELLSEDQMNPMKTTTYGTGELIKAAMDYGARKILLAVGGSATVDGGIGAAMALGWKFIDENGESVPLGGRGLERIVNIMAPEIFSNSHEKQRECPIKVLFDVDNPLCGEKGAAKIYGPQKGATPQMVERLEAGLVNLSQLVQEQLHKDIENVPGAGAAGGLAAGAMAFMDAKLVSGIETIMAHSRLYDELKTADWVITGEGCFDRQSLSGKVVAGVVKMAQQTKTRIAVIAGQVNILPKEYNQMGIDVVIASKPDNMPLDEALNKSRVLLQSATRRFIEKYLL